MKFCILASGSKGNMTYVETKNTKILIDLGLSYSCAKLKLASIGVNINDIDLIIITHEHSDHIGIKGTNLEMFMKKTKAVIYIHELSFSALPEDLQEFAQDKKVKFVDNNAKYTFKDLTIYTLELSHDTRNCLGVVLGSDKKYFAYITDTGIIKIEYFNILKICDAIVIEANHNIEMLENSDRDPWLIRRVLSVKGHLSNQLTASILTSVISNRQKVIILAHISEECNSPQALDEEIITPLKATYQGEIVVASQTKATKLFEV